MDPHEIIQNNARVRALLINHNANEMARLDAAGRVYATPHWRDGKYLYLLHPSTEPGQRRKREYIGANPTHVKTALAKIENARHYDELAVQNQKIKHALMLAGGQLWRIADELSRVAPLDLATVGTLETGDSGALPGRPDVTNGIDSPMVTDHRLEQLQLSPM